MFAQLVELEDEKEDPDVRFKGSSTHLFPSRVGGWCLRRSPTHSCTTSRCQQQHQQRHQQRHPRCSSWTSVTATGSLKQGLSPGPVAETAWHGGAPVPAPSAGDVGLPGPRTSSSSWPRGPTAFPGRKLQHAVGTGWELPPAIQPAAARGGAPEPLGAGRAAAGGGAGGPSALT